MDNHVETLHLILDLVPITCIFSTPTPCQSVGSAAMATEEIDYYALLEVGPESTLGQIRTAYRQRSLKVHPDRVCSRLAHVGGGGHTDLIHTIV